MQFRFSAIKVKLKSEKKSNTQNGESGERGKGLIRIGAQELNREQSKGREWKDKF